MSSHSLRVSLSVGLIVLTASVKVFSQAASAPFSSFGLGDYVGPFLIHNQGTAGAGVANPQSWYLNNINPSMLVYNRLTTFHAGIVGERRTIETDDQSEKASGGNVAYMTMGFPMLWNKEKTSVRWSSAFGLMPYSVVNYRIEKQGIIPNSDNTGYFAEEKASGGFNQLYWSHGVRIAKPLSVGIKGAYMFSSVIADYSNLVNQANQLFKYQIQLNEIVTVSGWQFSPSFHYRIDSIGKKFFFNAGGTFDLGRDLRSQFIQKIERKNSQGVVLQSDSLQSKSGTLYIPNMFTLGVAFGNMEKWTIAADYALTRFTGSTTRIGADIYPVTQGTRVSIGAEITPDSRSLTSLLKRMTYRTGVSFEKSPYLIDGTELRDFGINFGLSLPVNRISTLDLALRLGKRGDKNVNGLIENYFKIYFGITFNDQWFIKSRYD